MNNRFWVLLGLVACWNLGRAEVALKTSTQPAYDVLFVGNSLTGSNDLPKLVRQHAATLGITVNTQKVVKGGYAIVDHWAEGRVQNLVRNNSFDFVVIQQGPSSQFDGYEMLVNGGADYARLCAENNTQLAYFMVWPSVQRYFSFPGVISNYTAGAHANNAILIPVGYHWKQYIDTTSDYSYYSSDRFHPSRAGSQKAAEIIVESLFMGPKCSCESDDIAADKN